MQNSIIIIESPNKCEKIVHYSGAKVYATAGHFMQLRNDDSYVDYDTYEPQFIMMKEKEKSINFILQQCKNKEVYIATDPDREGYAIGYMIFQKIKNIAKSIKRAEFHEITKEGVEKGLKEAKDFSATNKNLYEAFKARSVGDKMVGYIMSPKLMQKFGIYKNISVGRVQTPALALIVKKELDIQAFNEKPKNERLSHRVTAKAIIENNEYILSNANIFRDKTEAQEFLDSIKNEKNALIASIESKESKKSPPKPFEAVSLIKEANSKLSFSSKDTMDLAQKLFEKGLITYHRTDSQMLSESFIDYLESQLKHHEWYEKRVYKAGKHSQAEAHEAIRITNLDSEVSNLNEKELKLYNLIKDNSMYSQAKDSLYQTMKYEFNILGRIFNLNLRIPTYLSAFEKNKSTDDTESEADMVIANSIPNLKEKDNIAIQEFTIKEIEAKAPQEYKESDFIPLLQKEGIGRPSTYASFVPTLLTREYIKIDKKGKKEVLVATQKGIQAIKYLEDMQDNWITTSEFTKSMEEILDLITESKATYLDFIKPLHARMGYAIPQKRETKKPTPKQIELATKIAKENNIELPSEVLESMKICSDFIDQHKQENSPTEKQLDYAKKIAENKGIALPKEVEISFKACSEFINKHKSNTNKSK
ncbi:type IA DNA topoisomerase [Helicobacter trogontum]|uniref:DNA topoisomerase n=1 Tax=Helicobacter trogontum TaxID=50960 RepID=A0A099VCS4_9HELI|nr:type IA DNA topoisomerase [Helicobacter trogontum]TLD84680.1 type IA DNA topoisomerase [Helicobacter trogontum]